MEVVDLGSCYVDEWSDQSFSLVYSQLEGGRFEFIQIDLAIYFSVVMDKNKIRRHDPGVQQLVHHILQVGQGLRREQRHSLVLVL